MQRVFKTRHFKRWMRKTELTDIALCGAVEEMAKGLIDSDLGGGVVKKRIGLAGRGKRGGARTLVATKRGSRWFLSLVLKKMTVPISPVMNLRRSKPSPVNCWPCRVESSAKPLKMQH